MLFIYEDERGMDEISIKAKILLEAIYSPERIEERKAKYSEEVRMRQTENKRVKLHRRLARKKALPDELTSEQYGVIMEYFGNACALTGHKTDLHLDHVIPLATGHGGTIYGNMIPLSGTLNSSKNDSNIFEWFETNRQRFELSQERFDNLISFLAEANEMTIEEYRDYVYWCHANPREVLTEDDEKEAI